MSIIYGLLQDTTTTLLTAALASRKDLVSGASSVTAEVGSSSSAQVSPAQAITHIQSPLATLSKNSQIVEGEDPGHAAMVNFIYSRSDLCSFIVQRNSQI